MGTEIDKVLSAISQLEGRPFRAWSIANRTGAFSYLTTDRKYRRVSSTLAALCRRGKLERVSQGVYAQPAEELKKWNKEDS